MTCGSYEKNCYSNPNASSLQHVTLNAKIRECVTATLTIVRNIEWSKTMHICNESLQHLAACWTKWTATQVQLYTFEVFIRCQSSKDAPTIDSSSCKCSIFTVTQSNCTTVYESLQHNNHIWAVESQTENNSLQCFLWQTITGEIDSFQSLGWREEVRPWSWTISGRTLHAMQIPRDIQVYKWFDTTRRQCTK